MNSELHDILSRPLMTPEAIAAAFDHCVTRLDIREVISKIPKQFGKFEVICIDETYTYFVIQNLVNFKGEEFSHVTTHEFYKIGGC